MMSKKLVLAVMSFTLLMFSASAAFALSTTLDFTGSAGKISVANQPFYISSGAFSASLTAWSHDCGASANAPFATLTAEQLHQGSNGMGVFSERGDNKQLDAGDSEADEMLQVALGEDVILEAVHFSRANNNDEFDMAVDNLDVKIRSMFGDDEIKAIGTPQPANGITNDYIVDFTIARIVGSIFQFYTDDNCDGYKIVGLTVTQVPEPATMGLLGLAALTGVGFRRRRVRGG